MRNFYWNKPVHESLTLVEPPEVEPVSLALAKKQCRIDADITEDDDLLEAIIIPAARKFVESLAKRAFITQTWQFNLDAFPFHRSWTLIGSPIYVPKPPLQQVNVVRYLDNTGDAIEIDEDSYVVDNASEPGRIVRKNGQAWPVAGFYPSSVQIEAVCGYGDTADLVPANYRQAILLMVGHYYRVREAVGDYGAEVPMAVQSLVDAESYGGYW